MDLSFDRIKLRILRLIGRRQNDGRIEALARQVSMSSKPDMAKKPVIIFNASTRLSGVSLNAAYAMLTGWALQLEGVPLVHFSCQRGLSRCVLGTNRDHPEQKPPCEECVRQSSVNTTGATVRYLKPIENDPLRDEVKNLPFSDLLTFHHNNVPLGELVLPALRWALRRNTLINDASTLFFLREYLISANQVASQFNAVLDEFQPETVVVFNGQFYPEATARWVARQRGIRVISHEVGLMPFTGYFTPGEATAYPIEIPVGFELNESQNARLDEYLSKRFMGDFSMAGIRFWSEMHGLDEDFLERANGFKQIVPIFTNVIFDTSQGHANTLFKDMFAWLDEILVLVRKHPETLFVIRAHPDEKRPGKESRETVADWVNASGCGKLPNVVFVDSDKPFSSYDLIRRSKFVIFYNSTIGLEASILGAAVLCGGKARFTQVESVFFPESAAEYLKMAEGFLKADEVKAPPEHRKNARSFLYYQLFRTSLPFDVFLTEDRFWNGYVALKPFDVEALNRKNSPTMDTILHGILEKGDFLLPE